MPNLPVSSPLGPTLETARLILRPPVTEDFDGYCAFGADARSMKFLSGVIQPPTVWTRMRTSAGSWGLDGFHFFSVLEKSSGAWIGRVGPIFPMGWPGREVGWGLLSAYWGKGYAREAASAAMDFVFGTLDWDRVIHCIAPDNAPSAAVAKALGSKLLGPGTLPEPYAHEAVEIWGQSREDWGAR